MNMTNENKELFLNIVNEWFMGHGHSSLGYQGFMFKQLICILWNC